MTALDWLLESDPAICWQAMRDLTESPPMPAAVETIQQSNNSTIQPAFANRARIPHEGLGAKILSSQQPNGSWLRTDQPRWASTLVTMLLLRSMGIDPADATVDAAVVRLETSLCWDDHPGFWDLRPPTPGGNPFFEGEEEPCINGGVLALGGYFGRPSSSLAQRLLSQQLEDGGWNCEAPTSSRSSFHTTICVLEGLLEYERAAGPATEIAAARARGEEYLLQRSLFRRLSTGEVANAEFLELAFPPRYHYDILRALDYFRAANRIDPRLSEVIGILESRRQPDGRWLLDRAYDEALPFPVAETVGKPSRWNTLRALRVLRWYGRQ
ncbi:hypothetical protein [Terriglobus albidus]|uniref:hypothetical protein n=1 Tax=Terriglobus albidus TaxID=1592106 RepID=UPI0021E074CC|nr:hypothetical protein [Terriglobus albidus]